MFEGLEVRLTSLEVIGTIKEVPSIRFDKGIIFYAIFIRVLIICLTGSKFFNIDSKHSPILTSYEQLISRPYVDGILEDKQTMEVDKAS